MSVTGGVLALRLACDPRDDYGPGGPADTMCADCGGWVTRESSVSTEGSMWGRLTPWAGSAT